MTIISFILKVYNSNYIVSNKINIFLLILFLCVFSNTFSQKNNKTDSISKNNFTVQNFLESNKNNNLLLKKLNEWLVIAEDSGITEVDLVSQFDENNKKFSKSIIRKINIKQVSPFAKSIIDTINISSSRIGKRLAKYRFETKKSIIKNNLQFKNGEFINFNELKDSERMLRALSFIDDALIIVEPASSDSSFVDVLVLTQDNYPYGGNINFSGNNVILGLYSKNVLGYGLELNHSFSSQLKENGSPGFSEDLRWSNIYGSNISLNFKYSKLANLDQLQTSVYKDFITQEIKYAGGFSLIKNHKVFSIFNPEDILKNNFDFFNQDYWFGRSFLINTSNYFNRSNFAIMAELKANQYFNLPDTLSNRTDYVNNYTLYTGFSFSKRDYFKNSLIYSYGHTEDVPHGLLGSLSLGYNYNNDRERAFLGLHFSAARTIVPNLGYFYFSSDFQSMFYKNIRENEIKRLQLQYISPLVTINRKRLRNFISLYYLTADNLSTPEYIYLKENTFGLSSYRSKTLKGLEKAVIKTENVLFLPKSYLGFKMAAYSFFDIGWISQNKPIFKTAPYYSMGFGFRIRNENLVIKTIQLKLAYFPRIPPGGVGFDVRLSGSEVGRFNDFYIRKPYIDIFK